jgi:hypothetical protein
MNLAESLLHALADHGVREIFGIRVISRCPLQGH